MNTAKNRALVWLASNFVGVTETKTNGGAMIERFQRAVDGKASGEPWCVGFVQHCAAEVDVLFDKIASSTFLAGRHNSLPLTEWTIGLWGGAQASARTNVPIEGSIVVWRSVQNPARGHCGIVVGVDPLGAVETIEGNTSNADGDQREGDGVWRKRRIGGNLPGFTRLGYVNPWP